MTIDEEELEEYGTYLYGKLQELKKSVKECNAETVYLSNIFQKQAKEEWGDIPSQLNDEIENLAKKFKNECKCIGRKT